MIKLPTKEKFLTSSFTIAAVGAALHYALFQAPEPFESLLAGAYMGIGAGLLKTTQDWFTTNRPKTPTQG